MKTNIREYSLSEGKVSEFLSLGDVALRFIKRPLTDEGEDISGYVVQGHITNKADMPIENLIMDVSYLDSQGGFLGLDKSGVLDVDELDRGQTAPFEIDLDIPEGTERCVLNASAKTADMNFLVRLLAKMQKSKD